MSNSNSKKENPTIPTSSLEKNQVEWNKCNVCKKDIPYGGRYYRCSVSSCNTTRFQLYFCSVDCWDAHVPGQRHRSAYAIDEQAPRKGS